MTSGAQFDLNYLGSGSIRYVPPSYGANLAEAAGVCLESQGHAHGVEIQVRGYIVGDYSVEWPTITEEHRRFRNDESEATEEGAAGVAILLVELKTPYSVIRRSRKGTGIDYWLGNASDVTFQRKARMEVSGIRKGNSREVMARVRQKLDQTKRSDDVYGNLPVYVIVVEFGTPRAEVRIR